MSLEDQIASRAREIKTDGYAMSIGEVASLYRENDMDIHPEFQRIFRWKSPQKSRLIESILLGIPVPPIFVSQRDDGVWDIIDGVQRLSTIFEFMGIYVDHNGELLPPSVLEATEYLPALEGYRWEGRADDKSAFTDAMRRDVKRAKLEFRIIRKESDATAKYDLFQRLNSGSALSQQETRDCLLVMINPSMFETVTTISNIESFGRCVTLSEAKEEQAYRQELVLRFFSHHSYDGGLSELGKEHGEWLTNWMKNAALQPEPVLNRLIDTELFRRVFGLLEAALGEDAFRPYNGTRHLGPFSISSYEFITAGMAFNVDAWETAPPEELRDRIRSIWTSATFRENSGTGVSPRRRVPRLVTHAREYFAR